MNFFYAIRFNFRTFVYRFSVYKIFLLHMIVDLQIPLFRKIGSFADQIGVPIWVVGGFVRDLLIDRVVYDIDFTVGGDAVEFAEQFAASIGVTANTFPRFRTAMIHYNGYLLEFVGTRKETYDETSRNPVVTEGTFEDDIFRRDFTLNALAVSLNSQSFGELIDLTKGKKDLEEKIIRTPKDPDITFDDDPLRILRCIRFASQLQCTIEPITYEALSRYKHRLTIISQERISSEFLKMLSSPKPSIALGLLFHTGILEIIFPEVYALNGVDLVQINGVGYKHKDVFWHTLEVLDNLALTSENLWLRYATLMHDIAKPRTKKFIEGVGWSFHGHEEIGARMQSKIFRRMKFPLEHLPYVEMLIRLHQRPMALVDEEVTDSAIRRLAATAGEALEDLFKLCRADITSKNQKKVEKYLQNYDIVAKKVLEVQERDQLKAFQSPVRGEEIMNICNLTPSKTVGYIKKNIEEAILDGIIANDYNEALEFLHKNKEVWLAESLV